MQIKYKSNNVADIFQLSKKILLQCRILSVAPVTIRKNNLQYSFIQSVVSFGLALIIIISTYLVIDVALLNSERSIFKATNLLLLLSGSTYAAIVWISAALQSKNLIIIFHQFREFDYKLLFFEVLNDIIQQKIIWNLHILQNIVTSIQILTFVTIAKLYFKDQIYLELLRTITLLVKTTVCLLTSFIINMLYFRFLIINNQLSIILKSKTPISRLCLYKICELHHRLSIIIKLFNKTFGVWLLFTFCTCFVTIVVIIFYVTVNLKSSEIDWLKLFFLTLLGTPFIVDVAYICHLCYRTILEVTIL